MATVTQHSLQMLNNATYSPHSIAGMPHGLGLLTTVASLPPKYRSRYLSIKTKCEIPLDLSRKSMSPQLECEVPMAATFAEVYTEPCSDSASQASAEIIDELVQQCQMICENNATTNTATAANNTTTATIIITKQQQHLKPITPPLTPTKKRKLSETSSEGETDTKENQQKNYKVETIENKHHHLQSSVEYTPAKPIKATDTAPKTGKNPSSSASKTNRNNKVSKKLKFDEETSSPVSGTIIRPLEDITDGGMQYSNGDIDPKYNIVEITEETKAELAAIKNVIGDYVCKLCRIKFDDAFGLAQHRCACIVLLEYRCPECGKQFNCPANLASHRRWHKPRKDGGSVSTIGSANSQTNKKDNKEQNNKSKNSEINETIYNCSECGKKFKRQAYLKKHQLTHQQKVAVIISAVQQQKPNISSEDTEHTMTTSSETSSPLHQQQLTTIQQITNSSPSPTKDVYDDQEETMSDYSSVSSSQGYGRLQIVEAGLTEEENIAAAALTNLRNCASVIQHTTLAH